MEVHLAAERQLQQEHLRAGGRDHLCRRVAQLFGERAGRQEPVAALVVRGPAGKNSLSLDHFITVRVFKGFSFNTGGGVSRIHDQLYLPKRGASDEEILVRRRQLAISFSYFFMGGFSYTFGSIYNNVVNSRFDGSGLGSGGGMSISYSY